MIFGRKCWIPFTCPTNRFHIESPSPGGTSGKSAGIAYRSSDCTEVTVHCRSVPQASSTEGRQLEEQVQEGQQQGNRINSLEEGLYEYIDQPRQQCNFCAITANMLRMCFVLILIIYSLFQNWELFFEIYIYNYSLFDSIVICLQQRQLCLTEILI